MPLHRRMLVFSPFLSLSLCLRPFFFFQHSSLQKSLKTPCIPIPICSWHLSQSLLLVHLIITSTDSSTMDDSSVWMISRRYLTWHWMQWMLFGIVLIFEVSRAFAVRLFDNINILRENSKIPKGLNNGSFKILGRVHWIEFSCSGSSAFVFIWSNSLKLRGEMYKEVILLLLLESPTIFVFTL